MACTENQNNEVSCQLCKTSYSSEWELKEHLWSLMHHVKLEQKSKDTMHQCVLCQTSTENLVDYGRHLNEQKHKQAFEKAKEKKKAKPKSSSSSSLSRHTLQKVGRQKSKKSLLPNPNWHLSSSDPLKRESLIANKLRPPFSNWKPKDDWCWKNNSPEVQGSKPFRNNRPYWNNYNDKFFSFNANNKRSWKKPVHLLNGNVVEVNQQHPNHRNKTKNAIQPLMSKKFVLHTNQQKLRKGLIPNKTPPLVTKNSKSFTDSNYYSEGQKLPLGASSIKSSSKAADNSKNTWAKHNSARIPKSKKLSQSDSSLGKPKFNTSPQVSKLKSNVSKLKGKGGNVKSAVNRKKEKSLFVIDKVGTAKVTENCGSAGDNASRKVNASTLAKKSDNICVASVYKRNTPLKKKLQVLSQNGNPLEKRQISNENKTKLCRNSTAAKTNSPVNPKDSNAKNSGCTNSKEDSIPSLKRSFCSVDSPNSASSSNLNKKQKTLTKSDTLESRRKLNKADVANLVTSPGMRQKPLVKIHSSKTNDSSEKDKQSHLNPTKEQKTLPKVLSLEPNENGFKVNKELVTKLHNNLTGKHSTNPTNSNIELKTNSQENLTHSKDETNPTAKQAATNVRQEELVKMMKLPRLSRKEKMHLSSLLQSYTKLQNKKLAVPRLTMQLSGLYNNSSQDITDVGEMSELQLPAGMEEQIAYLIKRENLEADDNTDNQNTRLSTHSEKPELQNTKGKVSSTEKGSVKNKTVSENSQAGSLSAQDISNARSADQCLSDAIPSPVETILSQENTVTKEPANINSKQNNIQVETNSLSCTTLSNPSESLTQTNSSDPVTTGTQSNSSENIPTSNESNSESVFSKVYSLTLREEQIRSSIVDTNEKMNYLRKLIEDSQMALQRCCVEHKLLLEEENQIREQRLKILQDAMNGKTSSVDAMNSPALQQTSPHQSLPAPIPNSQPASTSSQTNLAWGWSSISHHQEPLETTIQNQPSQQPSSYYSGMSGMISSGNRSTNQTQESLPRSLDHSSNLSTVPLQVQSSVPANPLPCDEPSTVAAVCRNKASRQCQNNGASLPLNMTSSHSDTNPTDNGFSENRNADVNFCANVTQNGEPSLGLGHVTIKQEPLSPPPSEENIEMTLSSSEGLVHNNTCDNGVLSTKPFSDGRQAKNATVDGMSDTLSSKGLLSASTENESFERVQIKKERLTPPPSLTETQESHFKLKLSSLDSRKKQQSESQTKHKSGSFQTKSTEKEKNRSDRQTDEVTADDSPEMPRGDEPINSVTDEDLRPIRSTTPEMQPVINFESVQIKKEPLTPPPLQVEGEETFFVPRLLPADNSEENPALQNHAEHQMEIGKTVENICSPSSPRNPLESEGQNENPGKSGGMSMTYLGSMPNNFLEQLTLSWKKQNMSATMEESVALSNEHSFSDSESTSSRTVCTFIKRSLPKFSVPARMNPRVCLEPLNMKFHRKRTFSEPVSASDCSSLSTGNLEQKEFPGKEKSLEKSSSVQKSSEEGRSNCDDKLHIVKEEDLESPEVKQKNFRSEKEFGFKGTTSENQTHPSTVKNEPVSCADVTDPLLNNKEDNIDPDVNDVDNIKEFKICSPVSAESLMKSKSGIKQNSPIRSLNESSATSPNVIQSEINSDPKFPTDPLNILNSLSSLHVVRTKKFPRRHVERNQLPNYKGANSPVNGLYIFENQLYASYQGNSPCKFSIGSGECLQVYNCDPFNVQCMLVCRISSNKIRLFSGGASELLIVFDEETGELCSKIDTYKKIYSFHENWGNLFVGLADGGVTKLNLKSLRKTSELSYGSKPINCLATCTEGAQKLLCVGAYDASILIVDAMTGLLLKTLNCYHRLLYSIKVHHSLIFSCSSDKTLQVHDITSGKLLRCLQDHASTISCLHVDDDLLVTGSHDKRINIYNSSNSREAPVIFYTASKEPISCLAVHNRVIYCGNFFGDIETIQFDTGQKWSCKYDSCEMTFGQRQGLFYHLVNQHLQMTGLNKKKCLWQNCEQYIYSVLDITEHCENHINKIHHPE